MNFIYFTQFFTFFVRRKKVRHRCCSYKDQWDVISYEGFDTRIVP